MNLDQLFADLSNLNVAVIGDVMLDSYCWGKVDRISPEAPVPIVALDKKEYRIGGAGNVALNLASLGASTHIFSVVGNDHDGKTLAALMRQNNIVTDYLVFSGERITTSKTRIMGRNQQMMRLDSEITEDIDANLENELLDKFRAFIRSQQPKLVILEDYNKGVLTERLIAAIVGICNQNNIITAVDPKRRNFFAYKGVTIFKPNLKEVKDALHLSFEVPGTELLNNIHLQLKEALEHSFSLITLSEHGIFYQGKEESEIIPSHVRNIADVSGAGDTVIAVASLVYAASNDIRLAAQVANIAGGLVCEEVGTVAIGRQKLADECKSLLAP